MMVVNKEGHTIANYRAQALDEDEKKWASEGFDDFFDDKAGGFGKLTMGLGKWPTRSFKRECFIHVNHSSYVGSRRRFEVRPPYSLSFGKIY